MSPFNSIDSRCVKADLHGTIFAYDCHMHAFFVARAARVMDKIVYDFHDIELPVATIVVGF